MNHTEEQRQRIRELVQVRDCLLPDVDDPAVMSELTAVEAALATARQALTDTTDAHAPSADQLPHLRVSPDAGTASALPENASPPASADATKPHGNAPTNTPYTTKRVGYGADDMAAAGPKLSFGRAVLRSGMDQWMVGMVTVR